jgi:hypothetical protein
MVYAEWLASAMASYLAAPEQNHLGEFVLAFVDLEEARRSRPSPEALLAAELAYDRALINLSLLIGIDAGPERFEVPGRERDRLHRAVGESLPALQEQLFAAGLVDE